MVMCAMGHDYGLPIKKQQPAVKHAAQELTSLFLFSSPAVRVRPSLKPTDPGYDLIPQRFQRHMVQVMSNTTLAIDAPQGRKVFVFDRVFSPEVDQAGVWEYLEDCVNAFTSGYNVSLLAYGQSGAGKSYTMGTSGPSEQNDFDNMGESTSIATRTSRT